MKRDDATGSFIGGLHDEIDERKPFDAGSLLDAFFLIGTETRFVANRARGGWHGILLIARKTDEAILRHFNVLVMRGSWLPTLSAMKDADPSTALRSGKDGARELHER